MEALLRQWCSAGRDRDLARWSHVYHLMPDTEVLACVIVWITHYNMFSCSLSSCIKRPFNIQSRCYRFMFIFIRCTCMFIRCRFICIRYKLMFIKCALVFVNTRCRFICIRYMFMFIIKCALVFVKISIYGMFVVVYRHICSSSHFQYVVLCLCWCLQKIYKPNEVVEKNPQFDDESKDPEEEEEPTFYINTPADSSRPYVNVELKSNQRKHVSYFSVDEKIARMMKLLLF